MVAPTEMAKANSKAVVVTQRMQPRYDSFMAQKAPMLDSIPSFLMSDYRAHSTYTRAIAQEMLLILKDQGFKGGDIDRHIMRQIP